MKVMQADEGQREEIMHKLDNYNGFAKSVSKIIEKINMCILSSPRTQNNN